MKSERYETSRSPAALLPTLSKPSSTWSMRRPRSATPTAGGAGGQRGLRGALGRGATSWVARSLRDVMTAVPKLPASGRSIDLDVTCDSGQVVTLTFARKKGAVAVVARHLAPASRLARRGRSRVDGTSPPRASAARIGPRSGRSDERRSVGGHGRARREGAFSWPYLRRAHRRPTHLRAHLALRRRPPARGLARRLPLLKALDGREDAPRDATPADDKVVRFTTDELPLLFEGSVRASRRRWWRRASSLEPSTSSTRGA